MATLAVLTNGATAWPLPGDPMHHGVVFFCPEKTEDAIRQLERIKEDGFDLIKFASWIWTLPKPGSDLEKRVQAVLDWCDQHGMAFFLLHNIQYGGEAGGLNNEVLHPERSLPFLEDWSRVLRGHRCVIGVILGNEVGPSLGTPEAAPLLWEEFRRWLAQRHGSVEQLNAAWVTEYRTFNDVGLPQEGSPGWVDYRCYARQCFAQFYRVLIEKGLRPVLGDKLYGSKTSLDPFLHRACRQMTMTCWDDLLAQHPLWEIKCAADTTGKPLFNAELHLCGDGYQYFPSPEQSRYRYFTSALIGEYLTASFAWGRWSKPEIQKVHSTTPAILADLRRLEKHLRLLAQTYRNSGLMALVTEDNYYRPRIDKERRHPLALLYAHLSALGRPWRYLLEDDLSGTKRGTIVVWTQRTKLETAQALTRLPGSVPVLAIEAVPKENEYGQPLPVSIQQRLGQRLRVVPLEKVAEVLGPSSGLPEEYRRVGVVKYWWWSEKRGHFQYEVPYCTLEARRARGFGGTVVAVVNNSLEARSATIPWAFSRKVVDLASGQELNAGQESRWAFEALDVKVLLIR